VDFRLIDAERIRSTFRSSANHVESMVTDCTRSSGGSLAGSVPCSTSGRRWPPGAPSKEKSQLARARGGFDFADDALADALAEPAAAYDQEGRERCGDEQNGEHRHRR
jgi:hypothetical protein